MRTQGQVVAPKGCDALDLCVQSLTVIETRKVVQTTDEGWDAVVTSGGKGTFLIRRRKGRLSAQCPLLCYEIRRSDAGSRDGQFGGQSGGDAAARQPTPAAIAVSACAFRNPPRGCDRDERETP